MKATPLRAASSAAPLKPTIKRLSLPLLASSLISMLVLLEQPSSRGVEISSPLVWVHGEAEMGHSGGGPAPSAVCCCSWKRKRKSIPYKPDVLIITEPSVKNNEQSFVFNYTLAKTIVEYASAVYMTDLTALYTWTCSRCNDLTQGFEMRCIIVDIQNCLQAFVGVDHNLNSIIVAIRGTQENSIQNWIKDLVWKQVNLNYPNMPNAKVHTGFYSSYNNTLLRPAITNAVRKARDLYGDISVIVTGHSMGGAMASFCALDLAISFGSDNVHLMTFGQPRVGNAAFASYFAKYVPNTIRVTHEHDTVPHLPPYFFFLPRLTYHHFPREVWEHGVDGNTTFQVCDGSGEDPNCCRSVFVLFWSASDHLTYLGVNMAADDWSTCRIVLAQSVEQFQMDLASNAIALKNSVDVVIPDHGVQID